MHAQGFVSIGQHDVNGHAFDHDHMPTCSIHYMSCMLPTKNLAPGMICEFDFRRIFDGRVMHVCCPSLCFIYCTWPHGASELCILTPIDRATACWGPGGGRTGAQVPTNFGFNPQLNLEPMSPCPLLGFALDALQERSSAQSQGSAVLISVMLD